MGLSKCEPHRWEMAAEQELSSAGSEVPQKLPCPFGKPLFEVTWPNMTRMKIENDIEGVGTPSEVFYFICVLYGYIPYAIGFICFVELLIRRGTRELSSMIFLGLLTLLNELIFKNIVMQARPERSCLSSCGMPSGHSTMSIGLLTMCLLDTALRVCYRPESDFLSRTRLRGASWCRMTCGYVCHEFKQKFTLIPLSAWDELSTAQAVLYAILWFLLLAPVPMARIATNDHTTEQVFYGTCLGFVEALCWCYFVRHMQHKYNHLLGESWKIKGYTVLTHNFALPRFIAEERVSSIPCKSGDPDRELLWYELVTQSRRAVIQQYEQRAFPHQTSEEDRYLQHRQTTLSRLRSTLSRVPERSPKRNEDDTPSARTRSSGIIADGSDCPSKIELAESSSMIDGRNSFVDMSSTDTNKFERHSPLMGTSHQAAFGADGVSFPVDSHT